MTRPRGRPEKEELCQNPYGKRIVGLYVPTEILNKITTIAKSKGLSRNGYIMNAINTALEEYEEKRKDVFNEQAESGNPHYDCDECRE